MKAYDEFSMFQDNATEYGVAWKGAPTVRRTEVDTSGGRISALVWGTSEPECVFIHGGAQNAHTWDTVMLALDRPGICVDVPGHGHSQWRDDGDYSPWRNADTLAEAIAALAPQAKVVTGMSLGGLTTIRLASAHPHIVRRAVIVDVTPGVDAEKSKLITNFVNGPQFFESFDELLARTIEHNPTRTEASLRRGVLHNAHQLDDGTWKWRYDRLSRGKGMTEGVVDFAKLWDDVDNITAPVLLAVGTQTGTVVNADDVAEFQRRQPTLRVEYFTNSGHSLQGDEPVKLAETIRSFAFSD
ncbi:MAG: alpha/beta fold hydrolase [Acidimicrobiia bacterium]